MAINSTYLLLLTSPHLAFKLLAFCCLSYYTYTPLTLLSSLFLCHVVLFVFACEGHQIGCHDRVLVGCYRLLAFGI
ncbi:hypothetical protein QBC41DRAFT_331527 [Cercophora samala]|uniref:Uncharacterized protein n=1 Tax=Cercophora samala TaxID=330535 RepID=A0AA39YWQ7_9PEZI|nr:hypothetical protein QBC41DRAFT_331527 [Cercophora samala]